MCSPTFYGLQKKKVWVRLIRGQRKDKLFYLAIFVQEMMLSKALLMQRGTDAEKSTNRHSWTCRCTPICGPGFMSLVLATTRTVVTQDKGKAISSWSSALGEMGSFPETGEKSWELVRLLQICLPGILSHPKVCHSCLELTPSAVA